MHRANQMTVPSQIRITVVMGRAADLHLKEDSVREGGVLGREEEGKCLGVEGAEEDEVGLEDALRSRSRERRVLLCGNLRR